MNEDEKCFLLTMIAIVLVIVGGFYFALLCGKQESIWATKCEQAGGVPSRYSTMVGKVHQSERLCIKKDNVVEVTGE